MRGPVEGIVRDLFPAHDARRQVRTISVLPEHGGGLGLTLELECCPRAGGRHRVVLAVGHDQERRAVVVLEVDLARRVRVEVRQGGLEEDPARTGHRVAVVDRLPTPLR